MQTHVNVSGGSIPLGDALRALFRRELVTSDTLGVLNQLLHLDVDRAQKIAKDIEGDRAFPRRVRKKARSILQGKLPNNMFVIHSGEQLADILSGLTTGSEVRFEFMCEEDVVMILRAVEGSMIRFSNEEMRQLCSQGPTFTQKVTITFVGEMKLPWFYGKIGHRVKTAQILKRSPDKRARRRH